MLYAFAALTHSIKHQLSMLQPAVSAGPGWLKPGKGAFMGTAVLQGQPTRLLKGILMMGRLQVSLPLMVLSSNPPPARGVS